MDKYNEDPRPPCRYGDKCYQRNPDHKNKYKHPPKNSKRKLQRTPQIQKKIKLDEEIQTNSNSVVERTQNEAKPSPIQNQDEKLASSNKIDENAEEASKIEQYEEDDSIDSEKDPKAFITSKFLVHLPDDFYQFWNFCKDLKPTNTNEALKEIGLELVGPFDVLAGKFKNVRKSSEEYLCHWRYYFDPPEFLTVLKGDVNTGYHIGYFFDTPEETPFLLSNHGLKDGIFTRMGDNIFAALYLYLEDLKKLGDPFKKIHIGKLLNKIKAKAEELNLSLSISTKKTKAREMKVVAKTHNKIGLNVPYNKKTQLGYRDLALEDKELMTLLTKLQNSSPDQKPKFLSDLQPALTYASIALDECDFGTGVKLGWQILYHGVDCLNSTIAKFLGNSYRLLNREAFARIAEAHMKNRKKTCNLSIV